MKNPLPTQESSGDGTIYTPLVVRPNVPQMAELPCLLGVVDSTPLQDRTSFTNLVGLCRFDIV